MSARRRQPLSGPLRWLAHGPMLAFGWGLMVWLWWLVARQPWQSSSLERLVLGALVLFPLLTGAWILHNLGIYHRLGPRRTATVVAARYDRDYFGRAIDADWAALDGAQWVEIACGSATKRYQAGGPAAAGHPPEGG